MSQSPARQLAGGSPFDLNDQERYLRWREHKLASAPARLDQLLVEVTDPRKLTRSEHDAILARCRRCNMALYRSPLTDADKTIPHRLGTQFGLTRLDHNFLADEDAITSLTVNPEGDHPAFIPYTNRPIHWHTDGYYNPPERTIRGLLLHCVQPAAVGGENRLMDPEMLYILLRDEDPDYIRVLMEPDAMTIPARTDEQGEARPAQSGPVFSVNEADGTLHLRYTARTRSIEWKDTAEVKAAAAIVKDLLGRDLPWIYRRRLEAGMGLISNNVLHDRGGFEDDEKMGQRLLYRARYYDRMTGTGRNQE